ncbi:MAG: hypothetical protein ACJA04_000052 [Cellvibrionaceae bacterium]|jgi:hypothetical protein
MVELAENIVDLSPQAEGLNMRNRLEAKLSMMTEVKKEPEEIQALTTEGREQHCSEQVDEAKKVTAGSLVECWNSAHEPGTT